MKRNEIWLINLSPTTGAEIQKTRPAIIVSDDDIGVLPLRVIVPLTDWKDRYAAVAWMVKIEVDGNNNLTKTSAADCFQVRSVATERFVKQIGQVGDLHLVQIESALAKVLKINNE